jgi:tetratricopeptide (TPR) repeat protein
VSRDSVVTMPSVQLLAGRFVIEHEVGRGAVGIVYRAYDHVSGQSVALKVIASDGVDEGGEARFRREGRVLAGLHHPGIVRVVAFGQLEERRPYVAMEWLDGENLAKRQERAPLSVVSSLRIAADVCEALGAAHGAGIVHRDVKPSNVILARTSESGDAVFTVKLVDFGVAAARDVRLTQTGTIVGTPAYMAPEQARGDEEIDARADLYSLGATLFELIVGRPPHFGPTPVAILARLVTTPAPRLGEIFSDVSPAVDELVASLLALEPSDRPSSAIAVAARLRSIADELDMGSTPPLTPAAVHDAMSVSLTMTKADGGLRLITSIVATHVPKGPSRTRILTHLRARGADATELGGNAIVAHLGVRKSVGDEASRALDLGLRIAKLGASVGVASGRTRIEHTRPTGDVVDRAAALARDAVPGQVLVDATTTELARGRFDMDDGVDGRNVVGSPHVVRRQAGTGIPFVGRDAELLQIVAAFERCAEDRTSIVVTITGAPGIGKTRLRAEALACAALNATPPRVVHARAEAFAQRHALGVLGDVARGLAGVPKGASLQEALDATDVLIATCEVPCSDAARDLFARLVANEPLPKVDDERGARDALWLALTDMAIGLSHAQPLALAIEDAQWADSEGLSWLDHLAGRASGHRVFVVVDARPALWRHAPSLFEGRDHVRIELRPLSRKHARAMALSVLADRTIAATAASIAEDIAAQSGGLPLFAEELARLAAAGRDTTGAPTIEAAMQVNLDALEDASREAAAKLSVFGQVGWEAALAELGVRGAAEAIRDLAAAEILVEQAHPRFAGTREVAFKHALMREVAYASLGEELLRDAHARAGRWLARMGEDDAIVARHLELGGEGAEAAEYLEKAGSRALAAHALPEAVSLFERALAFAEDRTSQFARALLLEEAWSRLDARAGEREAAVRAMEDAVDGPASSIRARGARARYEDACGGDEGTTALLAGVRREAAESGLADEEARCAASLAVRLAHGGELSKAADVADSLLTLSQRHNMAGAEVDAWQSLAMVHQARGEVGAALEARRCAARSASAAGLKAREAMLTINVGFALTTLGAAGEARLSIESGIALAQAIGSPGIARHGRMNLLCWAATFGAEPSLEEALAEPRTTAEAALSGSWVPHDRATLGVLFYRGMEMLRGSGFEAGAAILLKIAATGYRATNMLDVLPVAIGLWGEAERRCGRVDQARRLASEAATLLDGGSPSLLNEVPVYLALHDAYVDLGLLGEARDAIVKGIPRLVTRVKGLAGTAYTHVFLTEVPSNAGFLAAAEAYGVVPDDLQGALSARPRDGSEMAAARPSPVCKS